MVKLIMVLVMLGVLIASVPEKDETGYESGYVTPPAKKAPKTSPLLAAPIMQSPIGIPTLRIMLNLGTLTLNEEETELELEALRKFGLAEHAQRPRERAALLGMLKDHSIKKLI